MKLLKLLAPAVAALALAACASESQPKRNDHSYAQASASEFICENGFTVKVNYHNSDHISVNYGLQDHRTDATLENAVSGSGVRYVSDDKKTEWHQKANDAIFSFTDRYGNVTETICRSDK